MTLPRIPFNFITAEKADSLIPNEDEMRDLTPCDVSKDRDKTGRAKVPAQAAFSARKNSGNNAMLRRMKNVPQHLNHKLISGSAGTGAVAGVGDAHACGKPK